VPIKRFQYLEQLLIVGREFATEVAMVVFGGKWKNSGDRESHHHF
jgi:hypothetical protein